MTATEPRTLAQMTPREAWEAAWEQAIGACRHVLEEEATARGLEAVRNIARQFLDQEPEDAPVVARDEAAELRAAITAYLAALDEFRKQEATLRALPEGMGIGQAGVSAAYNLDDAEAVLRRLAASEGQP